MARFLGGVKGGRAEVTRLGGASTGLLAYAQGWNCGVSISAMTNAEDQDVFLISINGGSNGARNTEVIGSVKGGKFYPADAKMGG